MMCPDCGKLRHEGECKSRLCERCGKEGGTLELHSCPYNSDVNNSDEPVCNCCEDCMAECLADI